MDNVGACTTETLQSGVEYTFEMAVAATDNAGSYGGDTSGELQMFGIPSCSTVPIPSTYASLEGSYDLLDEVTVNLVGGDAFQGIALSAAQFGGNLHAVLQHVVAATATRNARAIATPKAARRLQRTRFKPIHLLRDEV